MKANSCARAERYKTDASGTTGQKRGEHKFLSIETDPEYDKCAETTSPVDYTAYKALPSNAALMSLLSDEQLDPTIKIKILGFLISNSQNYKIDASQSNFIKLDACDNNSLGCARISISVPRIETVLDILTGCDRIIAVNLLFSKDALYNFINAGLPSATPCAPLPPAVISIILSVKKSKAFCFRMFLAIYLKIQHASLDLSFIQAFISADIAGIKKHEKACVLLAKAKEYFKIFKATGDYKALTKSLRILEHGKNVHFTDRRFADARFKIFFYVGDFYTAMECGRGSLNEYTAMAQIDRAEAIARLDAIVWSPVRSARSRCQHALLLAGLSIDAGNSPLAFYKKALAAFPSSSELRLELLRSLKHSDLAAALAHANELKAAVEAGEISGGIADLILFEMYIIIRRLRGNYMAFLYGVRKRRNIPLFSQEIAYFEHKTYETIDSGDSISAGLFLIKEIVRRDCNSDGCCSECRVRYAHLMDLVYKYKDNGDLVLLHYMLFKSIEIKKVADHLDPALGFYWPRLARIHGFEEKAAKGVAMILGDFR